MDSFPANIKSSQCGKLPRFNRTYPDRPSLDDIRFFYNLEYYNLTESILDNPEIFSAINFKRLENILLIHGTGSIDYRRTALELSSQFSSLIFQELDFKILKIKNIVNKCYELFNDKALQNGNGDVFGLGFGLVEAVISVPFADAVDHACHCQRQPGHRA